MRSYIGIRMNMKSRGMTGIDGPGTLNPLMLAFMVVLCCIEKV